MIDIEKIDSKKSWLKSIRQAIPESKKVLSKVKVFGFKLVRVYQWNTYDSLKIYDVGLPAKLIADVDLPNNGSIGKLSGSEKMKDLIFSS